MIDIHGHILHCGDDGAASREETIKMGEAFHQAGVSCVAATPHFIRGSLEIEPKRIIALTEEYNQIFRDRNINVSLVPGMEVEMCRDIPGLLKEGRLLTLNNKGKYLLVELPFHCVPPFTQQIFYELRLQGVIPILAHPERNRELLENPEPLWDMVGRGVLLQVNGGSLLGYFGTGVRKRAVSLIESNLVHLIAGDAHQSFGERGPCLHLVRPVLDRLTGEDKCRVLLNHNPRMVLDGGSVVKWDVKEPKSGFAGFIKNLFRA